MPIDWWLDDVNTHWSISPIIRLRHWLVTVHESKPALVLYIYIYIYSNSIYSIYSNLHSWSIKWSVHSGYPRIYSTQTQVQFVGYWFEWGQWVVLGRWYLIRLKSPQKKPSAPEQWWWNESITHSGSADKKWCLPFQQNSVDVVDKMDKDLPTGYSQAQHTKWQPKFAV